jgi:hypothetical protein
LLIVVGDVFERTVDVLEIVDVVLYFGLVRDLLDLVLELQGQLLEERGGILPSLMG